ncbi:Protein of unknown function [Algoriphagus locisalis]|uniref:DUF3302 domain-containing protein n=2 Tax=Algoriphagus TaxID=246875 RepID=A0A1I7ARH9_9BACT|nr:DUF3302 domain-containing protein [Algoriphagus locisalis]SFT77508.1 Protein of unknown function [Algoriphagus locisalis]
MKTSKFLPKLNHKSSLFLFLVSFILIPETAFANTFEDKIAEVVSWIALIVAPIVLITVFLMVHVLPEKIAEKRNHPQAEAIKTLCILSLFFGGLLWPLAWLWTYSKPVFYKMAYGTDKGDYHEETMEDLKQDKALKASSE